MGLVRKRDSAKVKWIQVRLVNEAFRSSVNIDLQRDYVSVVYFSWKPVYLIGLLMGY